MPALDGVLILLQGASFWFLRAPVQKCLSDAQIQLISGHESKKAWKSQHLSLESVDKAYQDAVQTVGI